MEREAAFQTSIDVDARLTGLQSSLNSLVGDLNAATERTIGAGNPNSGEGGGGGGPGQEGNSVKQVLQVLNHHHEALLWLETTCQGLQQDLNVVGDAFQAR
jgi:hypothetical protein